MPKTLSHDTDDVIQARITWERYQTTCRRMGLEGWPTFEDFVADVGVPPRTPADEKPARMVRIDKAKAFIPGNVTWDLGRGRGGNMSDETVLAIYVSNETQKRLALKYGVSQAMISRIKRNESYAHVPKPKMVIEVSAATGGQPVRRPAEPPILPRDLLPPDTGHTVGGDGMIYGEPTDEEEEAYAQMMRDMGLPLPK